ncbi:MAG: ParM/StbA family protein [Psychrobacillus sp.]
MAKTFKAGVDAGNNSLKLWADGSEPLMIPSIYSTYVGNTTEGFDVADFTPEQLVENIDITIVSSKAIPMTNSRYIVGSKVLQDRLTPVEMESKSNKSLDITPVILTLAGLTVDAIKRNSGKNKINISYDIALALPVNTITQEAAKVHSERFIGTHEIIFHHESGKKIEVVITIEFSKCIPEGAAASWGVVFDEKGKLIKRKVEEFGEIKEKTFENAKMFHVDIGAGTSELVTTQGVQYFPKLSKGLGYGTKEDINKILTLWNREVPRYPIDSVAEFNEIYYNAEHHLHSRLELFSKDALHQLAERLSVDIINQINYVKDSVHIFIYGGGSIILKNALQEILEQKGYLENVTFLNDPLYVNARGLLVFASSPIFEQQKKTVGV